jgi:L-seryl-tRNA(Ser) seleniumtransferase
MSNLRGLPSVDQVINQAAVSELIDLYGRPLTIEAVRFVLDSLRQKIREGEPIQLPGLDDVIGQIRGVLEAWLRPTMVPVINATGVILHTNLGRAPLSHSAAQAMAAVMQNYHTLEYDLDSGKRGSRAVHAEALLRRLTEVEAALVVNNNAAALLLCLSALAKRKRVIIARSQLVEIGGGFRIPDVMKQSGSQLVEVGTTNRVHLRDFEEALMEPTALVLRAHHSNYKIVGFTTEPELFDMVQLAHASGVAVLDDLGSGALLDTANFGLAHEPTIQESLKAGADIVCVSGDKLLGGPQAGIVLGKASYVEKIRKHPLARVLRADKSCLAALSATLMHYLKDEAVKEIPIWQMISMGAQQVHERAERWRLGLGFGHVIEGLSTVGGGSLPEETLKTWLLALDGGQVNQQMAKMRAASPAVIARIEDGRVVLDPRTVFTHQEDDLLRVLTTIYAKK